MASKSRSAAAKKAWATRRKLYGKSGVGKSKGPSKRSISNMKKGISKQRAAGISVVKRGPRTFRGEPLSKSNNAKSYRDRKSTNNRRKALSDLAKAPIKKMNRPYRRGL